MKKAGARRQPTIKDVAALAGVGVGTASRVLSGRGAVSAEYIARVRDAMRRLDYRPNIVAQSMRLRATRAVGCMVSDLTQAVAAEMLAGAEEVLWEAGYAMVITSTHQDATRERKSLDVFSQRGLDGALLTITTDEDPRLARALEEIGIPVVLWERDLGSRFDAVLTDHLEGVRSAVRHLAGLGHRRLALVAAHPGTWVARQQIAGFHAGFAEGGLPGEGQTVLVTDEFGAEGLRELVAGTDPATALIVNVHDVPTVIRVLDQCSLRIPNDLSLVSIGDAEVLEAISPRISAVRGSGFEVGRQAAKLLLRRVAGEKDAAVTRIILFTTLVDRASCGPPPA